MDVLLDVEDNTVSLLQQLKAPPGKSSAPAMKRLSLNIAIIEGTGVLNLDLSWLNNNYQRALAQYVRKCSAYRLRELEPFHRYAAMVCFLWQTYRDTIDFAIEMQDKLILKVEKQAKVAFVKNCLNYLNCLDCLNCGDLGRGF